MERTEIENLALGGIKYLPVKVSDKEVYVRKMTWRMFETFASEVADYLSKLQQSQKQEGEDELTFKSMMSEVLLGNFVNVPIDVVRRLSLAVTFTDLNLKVPITPDELGDLDFDDVIGIAGIALQVHFSDNQKVKSFFVLVGSFLSVKKAAPEEAKIST